MYLVIIGWLYVAVMMAVAEATNSSGSILGAIVTFFLYGLMPVALVFYLMSRSTRRKAAKQTENSAKDTPKANSDDQADTGGHAASAAEQGGVTTVRKEP